MQTIFAFPRTIPIETLPAKVIRDIALGNVITKIGDYTINVPSYLGGDFVTRDDCIILYNNITYLNPKAYSTICDLERKQPEPFLNKETKDQIAAVMLLHGSAEQRIDALRYAGADSIADHYQRTIDDTRMRFNLDREISLAGFADTMKEAVEKYGQHATFKFKVAEKDNRLEMWIETDDRNSTTQT